MAALVGVLGIQALGAAADRTQQMYQVNVEGIQQVTAMRGLQKDLRLRSRDALLTVDPTEGQ